MNILQFIIPKSLVTYITTDSSVRQALEKMRFHRYAAFPVLDEEGKYAGTVRIDELFRYFLEKNEMDYKAAEKDNITRIMNTSYKPVRHDATMEDLIERLKEHNFAAVVDDRGCFIGIILRRDIMSFLLRYYNENRQDE